MKKLLFTYLFILGLSPVFAQKSEIDSLKHLLSIVKQDTNRVLILVDLSNRYRNINPDTSLIFGKQALYLAQVLKFKRGESRAFHTLGSTYRVLGDLPKGLDLTFKGLLIAEENNYANEAARCLNLIGVINQDLKDDRNAMIYFKRALKVNQFAPSNKETKNWEALVLSNIARFYSENRQLDSALFFYQKAFGLIEKYALSPSPLYISSLGRTYFLLGKPQKALFYMHQAIELCKKSNQPRVSGFCYFTIADYFKELNQPDSSIHYSKIGLAESQSIDYKDGIILNSNLLANLYETKDIKQAYVYQKLSMKTAEDVKGAKKVQELQKTIYDEYERQRNKEAERITNENRLKQLVLLFGLVAMLIVGFILYRNNRQKHKANVILERTLTQLKSTQGQLIQSEKLASLGELTAGIAHEIQNPLNFVNNFSELSVDLANELKEEVEKFEIPKKDKEYVSEIIGDLTSNQEKINHHGKRASSIVKGMLEHSRTSNGVKELTDINKLADEYLRLAYHGLRAKDKDFNVTLETHFDENLPKIEVIPQDIGRVLLNLINNAFYAVNFPTISNPIISISTQTFDNQIVIKIKDNGIGMNEATKAKIFQPFFTTKPTGQGTGLGLSLAYDIITKGHGGTIEVQSVESEGSTFIFKLPTQK